MKPWAYFSEQLWMGTFGNKSVQLCRTNAKAAYTGFYAYSDEFVEAYRLIADFDSGCRATIFTKYLLMTTFITKRRWKAKMKGNKKYQFYVQKFVYLCLYRNLNYCPFFFFKKLRCDHVISIIVKKFRK